jgi:hypothetical protein
LRRLRKVFAYWINLRPWIIGRLRRNRRLQSAFGLFAGQFHLGELISFDSLARFLCWRRSFFRTRSNGLRTGWNCEWIGLGPAPTDSAKIDIYANPKVGVRAVPAMSALPFVVRFPPAGSATCTFARSSFDSLRFVGRSFGGRSAAWSSLAWLGCPRRGSLSKHICAEHEQARRDGSRKKNRTHGYFASEVSGSENVCPLDSVIWSCLSAVKTAFGQSTFV